MAASTELGQNIFISIDSEKEQNEILGNMVKGRDPIQVKPKNSKSNDELTLLKPYVNNQLTVSVQYIEGPPPKNWKDAVVIFTSSQSKFFCVGDVEARSLTECTVSFKKIYKLQRRDFYRVGLPQQIIPSNLTLTLAEGRPFKLVARVMDLSSGGSALEVPAEHVGSFGKDTILAGTIKIGVHPEFKIEAVVRYAKKVEINGKVSNYQVGIEFTDRTVGFYQKVAAIVNDSQRIVFSRMQKA